MIILTLVLVFVVLIYARFRHQRKHLYELAERVPGIPALPFIGNAHQFVGDNQHIFRIVDRIGRLTIVQGGIIKLWIGPLVYFVITNPRDVSTIASACLEKDNTYRFMHSWIGNGLLSAPVLIWKTHRRAILPAFNQNILDNFIDIFNEQSEILVEKLRARVGEGPFDIFSYISSCTLDVVCETTMGVEMHTQDNSDTPYMHASISQMKIIYKRMFRVWLHPQFLFNLTLDGHKEKKNLETLHAFSNEVVRRRRLLLEKGKKLDANLKNHNQQFTDKSRHKRMALLDLMMDSSDQDNRFTDQELREEVDTMTIAGNDTTANTISFILIILGSHPKQQDELHQELKDIFGDSKRPVVKEDLQKMSYMERVIKESLRLYPTLPLMARKITRDVKLEKYTLPAGASAVVGIWALHRDQAIWGPDVDEFNPDRFLPEKSADRHPCSFMPFSYSVRGCIGRQYAMMSMKSILATLLRTYKFSAERKIDLKIDMLLRPVKGHIVSLEMR